MDAYDEVCVLIPTYNEAETIGDVVERFRSAGFENVLVIDGGSEDGTQELATEAGARVVEQTGSGKGKAVREGIEMIAETYVLLVDGDSTYRPEEANRLLEPLLSGEAEHVIGDRFADMEQGAMTRLNQAGNRIINGTFKVVHGRDLQDILSGYRAFTRESYEQLSLSATGFGIETEMSVECVRHNIRTEVVPITYEPRPDESETNLRPFRDGGTIILTLYRMTKTNNPLFYFGSVGAISALVGVVLAIYVAYDWFIRGISHEVIALAAGVGLLFGIQLVMFGVLSDIILTANREQTRRIERLAEQLDRPTTNGAGDSLRDDATADESARTGDTVRAETNSSANADTGDSGESVSADPPGEH